MISDYLNRLVCDDCNNFMAVLEAECIDFICTSPPYGKLRPYNGFIFDFEKTAQNIYRVVKTGGGLFVG